MSELNTKYGVIKGVISSDFYADGSLNECKVQELNIIKTKYGDFVPQYTEDEARRKYKSSLSFYNNGNIKSISLENSSNVSTRHGIFPAELITFYENESIKRIFPLNGKITGYWTEENEYEICPEIEINLEFIKIKKKVIGMQFYESEDIKSITFWPTDVIKFEMYSHSAEARIGISLYESGKIKSYEPNKPSLIKTPIGNIAAYDVNVLGINGDRNSLNFNEDGSIKSIITSTDMIEVIDSSGSKFIFEPGLKPNLFNNDIMDIVPVCIDFSGNKVTFNKNEENIYDIESSTFKIHNLVKKINEGCGNCESCKACK
ncbi:MAG: hypothetical protein Q8900_05895 [Bacillota bacterium]|nr:hypothetical protein [Bacillota bacterium]